MPKPIWPVSFATNRPDEGETVADAVNLLFSKTREKLKIAPNLDLATAYLNPAGFALIADEIKQAPSVRLLLGAEPQASFAHEPTNTLALIDAGLSRERDLVGFTLQADTQARDLVAWLEAAAETGGQVVEVRRFTKGFLHGKAFIANDPDMPWVLAGSSNLTYAGLMLNRELNLGYPAGDSSNYVTSWFDELWDDSEDFDLAGFYGARWEAHSPWIVFMRMLHELYGKGYEEDPNFRFGLNLPAFGRDAVKRAIRIMDELGGVLVCDEVGLGKTYTAGEIIHRAVRIQRQQVLVVVPAALKDSMWVPFLKKYDLFNDRVAVVSYDDLRLGRKPEVTDAALDHYALVVIDEAHNFRNLAAQRSEAIEKLLRGGKYAKKVVLLTATPVNNGLDDLQALISYFVKNQAQFASLGIPSITEYIRKAKRQDPESLSPEHLFDLMDQVAVRRTRKFIKEQYSGDMITGDDGKPVPIAFPTPRLHRVDYALNASGDALLEAVLYALGDAQADAEPPVPMRQRLIDRCSDADRLSMVRYVPSIFATDEDLERRQVASSALLESALLKRLESSNVALMNTLQRIHESHSTFLEGLEGGHLLAGKLLTDFGNGDEDIDDYIASLDSEKAADIESTVGYDVDALRSRLELDLALLERLIALARTAHEGRDPKADRLVEVLTEIATEARRPSEHGISEGDRRKVVVFSTYRDTIHDLRERVVRAIDEAPDGSPLSDYKNRIPDAVAGSKSGISQDERARVVAHFAPKTAGLRVNGEATDRDLYDVLFATDVLAEGVNLQQAGQVVSVDLPWNPMRLVQRHGRIDRLFSEHRYVDVHCYFPAKHLEELLKLEATLQRKIAYANAAIGTGEVIPGQISDPTHSVALSDAVKEADDAWDDTRKQIDAIFDENVSVLEARGGNLALSGEEYRRRLQKALEVAATKKRVLDLPFGSGSGVISDAVREAGWVFCARIGNHPKPWFRFVVADRETWKPYVRAAGTPEESPWILDDTLRSLIASDPRSETVEQYMPEGAAVGVFDAWEIAHKDIYSGWTRLTDPAAMQPQLEKAMREASELIQEHPGGRSNDELMRLLGCLNARWDKTIVDQVRSIVRAESSAKERVDALVALIDDLGLQPPEPIKLLPTVSSEEVRLICWMAITPKPSENV